jgi:hypothetical protein
VNTTLQQFIVDMEIMENPLANHHIYVLLIILIGLNPILVTAKLTISVDEITTLSWLNLHS